MTLTLTAATATLVNVTGYALKRVMVSGFTQRLSYSSGDFVMRLAFFLVLALLACPSFAELDERIKVVIEEPVGGGRYSGISNLRGWAVSPRGLGDYYLDVYIDGSLAFYLSPYGNRPDVGDAFPDYPDSDTGGFAMAFNYKDLSPGEHEIRVRAYDNAGNYNDAATIFTTERFESFFIADDAEVNLSTLTGISVLNNQTLLFSGATIEGRAWDFNVSWDRASQGLVITDIEESGLEAAAGSISADYDDESDAAGPISSAADDPFEGSDVEGWEINDVPGSVSDVGLVIDDADSGGAGGDGAGAGVAPGFIVSATCNTYVTSVSDGLVRFENGAILEEVFPGRDWFEEDPAFFVVFGDNLTVVVKYDAVLLTKVDRGSGWSAFWQVHGGAVPESCAYREPQPAEPLIPDYDVGSIAEYGPFEFVSVLPCNELAPNPASCYTVGDPEAVLSSDRACPTWDTGDQLLIPDAWEYYDVKNVWPVLNLTRLRYADGAAWCLE